MGKIVWARCNFVGEPPWQDMKKVLTKACLEPCRIVILCPIWRNENFLDLLGQIHVVSERIPERMQVFERNRGSSLLPGMHYEMVVALVDTEKNRVPREELDPDLVLEIENDSQGWGMPELLQEIQHYPIGGGVVSLQRKSLKSPRH